jgi:DNA-binding sugar fermentation-stimulating protein
VDVNGVVHVKNIGRCKALLLPGAAVRLEVPDNPKRKTKYDLVRDERVHERLSKNYLSVNFSTLHFTLLANSAITKPCSGGRAKERAAR